MSHGSLIDLIRLYHIRLIIRQGSYFDRRSGMVFLPGIGDKLIIEDHGFMYHIELIVKGAILLWKFFGTSGHLYRNQVKAIFLATFPIHVVATVNHIMDLTVK